MTTADVTSGLSTQPDPTQDRSGKPLPQNIADLLVIVRILLAYGRHLAATLEHRAAVRSFSVIAQCFGTVRVPLILARIARGILRAVALERVLLARARRGRDLVLSQTRWRERSARQPAAPQPPGQQQLPARRPTPEENLALPTLEELEAQIRRQPIGRVIADICRDLGVSSSLCEGQFSIALYEAITWYRGNFGKYYLDMIKREHAFAAEWDRDRTLRFEWPEQTREGIRRILGFFIGEEPVDPFAPPVPSGMAVAATHPP